MQATQLARIVSKRTGLPLPDTKRTIYELIKVMKETLESNEPVDLKGLLHLSLRYVAPFTHNDINTGVRVTSPAHYAPVSHFSAPFKRRIVAKTREHGKGNKPSLTPPKPAKTA